MFKVSIILCTVFIVSARSENPSWIAPTRNLRRLALEAIESKIRDFEELWNTTNYRERTDTKMIEVNQISDVVAQKIGLAKSKVDNDYAKLISGVKNINITDCSHHYENVQRRINVILTHSLTCVENAVEVMSNNSMSIDKIFINKRMRLDDIKQKIISCNDNIVDRESARRAMRCTSTAKSHEEAVSADLERGLKLRLVEIDEFLDDAYRNLEICTIEAGLETMDSIVAIVLGMIDRCIHQKIIEAHVDERKIMNGNNENETWD